MEILTGAPLRYEPSHRTGELIAVDGKLAQFHSAWPHPDKPLFVLQAGITSNPVSDWADILGRVPWSPPGSNTWNGIVRLKNGGEMHFSGDALEVLTVHHPAIRPRAGKGYQWVWDPDGLTKDRPWRKLYR